MSYQEFMRLSALLLAICLCLIRIGPAQASEDSRADLERRHLWKPYCEALKVDLEEQSLAEKFQDLTFSPIPKANTKATPSWTIKIGNISLPVPAGRDPQINVVAKHPIGDLNASALQIREKGPRRVDSVVFVVPMKEMDIGKGIEKKFGLDHKMYELYAKQFHIPTTLYGGYRDAFTYQISDIDCRSRKTSMRPLAAVCYKLYLENQHGKEPPSVEKDSTVLYHLTQPIDAIVKVYFKTMGKTEGKKAWVAEYLTEDAKSGLSIRVGYFFGYDDQLVNSIITGNVEKEPAPAEVIQAVEKFNNLILHSN